MYDCSAFTFLAMIEQSMLCKPGEMIELAAQDGAFSATGVLPANLCGGDLGAGYTHGFRHVIEAVRQLTGTSTHQVASAEVAMVMGGPGNVTSGALLRRKELA
jgi:acetyl-CoA acetyltransferase